MDHEPERVTLYFAGLCALIIAATDNFISVRTHVDGIAVGRYKESRVAVWKATVAMKLNRAEFEKLQAGAMAVMGIEPEQSPYQDLRGDS